MSAGYVYLLRERDFLSGRFGRYLKIGLTEREVGERIKEHQTGNAREVISIYEKRVTFMSKMETHLHHYFSSERINGEWFDLNDQRVQSEVIPLIEKLNDEQAILLANNYSSESFSNSPDNGSMRDPNEDEQQLFAEYKTIDEALTLAKARNKIHDLRLRNLIADTGGILGVISLNKKSQSNYFNKASFIKSLSPTEFALCHHDGLEFNSKIKFASATSIKSLDPEIQKLLKAEDEQHKANPMVIENLSKSPSSRSAEAENIHAEYLSSRKLLKTLQWDKELLTSQLLSKLGNDREIRGVVSWVRENIEVKDKWCLKSAREHLSGKVANYTSTRPDIVAVEIADGRCYKLAKS